LLKAVEEFHTYIVNNAHLIPNYGERGFDHGVGHSLLLLGHAKAPNYRKKKAFKDLAYYSEWPKVADAVIKANLSNRDFTMEKVAEMSVYFIEEKL
jgi:hypothetical protein